MAGVRVRNWAGAAKSEAAADFVQGLKRISEEERQVILAQTAGSLSPEDADAMEKALEEGCEQINDASFTRFSKKAEAAFHFKSASA
jgi:hypothetical protein